MKVVVIHKAALGRNNIVRYIQREFGDLSVAKFRKEYKAAKKAIGKAPFSFQKEWNLSTDELEVRFYVINGLTKMVYTVIDDQVVILDIWDTRHEPPTSVSLN